ncbi:Opioid growth factor receptor Short=OGFr [Rhizoctonia solani AG-1 IB]|uniref:Opioid growth factor receptor Short=OGFr n=1 Tax=Thanatephorus cucumeris (strain AG1-IB / isolate 7/3/14) TaxID=1108050 RepID=M5BVW5_THACB|nr:Opioid growth factor receptor Short=OGFr [Rhizoctonia solani AG-1 IB]
MLAHPLTEYEIEEITSSPTILLRVRRAYELMLDFYGMKLLDTESGLIGRKEDGWEERYHNLTYSSHNNLRITRILKCLSILSYPHYAAPFVLHVLNEQSEHGLLKAPAIQNSLDKWWANCNRNDQERETVQDVISRIRDKSNKWVFTRAMYEQMIHSRETQGALVIPE